MYGCYYVTLQSLFDLRERKKERRKERKKERKRQLPQRTLESSKAPNPPRLEPVLPVGDWVPHTEQNRGTCTTREAERALAGREPPGAPRAQSSAAPVSEANRPRPRPGRLSGHQSSPRLLCGSVEVRLKADTAPICKLGTRDSVTSLMTSLIEHQPLARACWAEPDDITCDVIIPLSDSRHQNKVKSKQDDQIIQSWSVWLMMSKYCWQQQVEFRVLKVTFWRVLKWKVERQEEEAKKRKIKESKMNTIYIYIVLSFGWTRSRPFQLVHSATADSQSQQLLLCHCWVSAGQQKEALVKCGSCGQRVTFYTVNLTVSMLTDEKALLETEGCHFSQDWQIIRSPLLNKRLSKWFYRSFVSWIKGWNTIIVTLLT